MAEENRYNILIDAGADFVLPWTWYDSNGIPVDLTGSVIQAQLRRFAEDTEVFDFVCTHNGQGGRFTLTLPLEVTARISWPNGVYDVFVTPAGGKRVKLLYGNAEVQHNVTKPVDGTFLYMIGIEKFRDLPAKGILNRLYFCYEDRKIYRWNGQNYVATSIGNGIQKIEKTGTTGGIVDHYRITYDDGSTFSYVVTNGRGVSGVRLVFVDELKKTYRMSFEDGTYFDFVVTDGGIRYAAFEVDVTNGYCYVTIPDGLETPDFSVNQTSGQMEVIVV